MCGLLHDIGKIGTYDGILDKPEKLTDEEYEIVKTPEKGVDVLLPIKQLKHIIPWIRGIMKDTTAEDTLMALRVKKYHFRRGYWQWQILLTP